MKHSEFYGGNPDNTYGLHLTKKTLRDKRLSDFKHYWLPELRYIYEVQEHTQDSWTILTQEDGTFDIYPKSNKILKRETNDWISNAHIFMKKTLLQR